MGGVGLQYHVMVETENLGQHSRTSEFLCVYTFVASLLHVCMCIYAHVHMYMWMSEPNRGYLTFFTLLFEVGFLTEPEFADSARLAGLTSRQPACLFLCWDYKHMPWYLVLDVGSGDHTLVLMIVWQALH